MSARRKASADRRPEEQQRSLRFESPADLEAFFRACDGLEGPAREPDWNDHLAIIRESRSRGSSGT